MSSFRNADKLTFEFRVREWFRQAKGREESKIRKTALTHRPESDDFQR